MLSHHRDEPNAWRNVSAAETESQLLNRPAEKTGVGCRVGGTSVAVGYIDLLSIFRGPVEKICCPPATKTEASNFGGGRLKKSGPAAMSDRLTGTMPELIAEWRAAMSAQGKTTRQVDDEAGLGEGYMAKILCGTRTPTAPTIAKIHGALHVEIKFIRRDHEGAALTP
jgi:hypothetical protein